MEPLDSVMVDTLNVDFERAASRQQFALAVFPLVSSLPEVSAILETLSGNERWKLTEFARDGNVKLLELRWTNSSGLLCNAVGLAPLLSMPVTRRAPFVAVGVWPGSHDNPHLQKPGKVIGLADTLHDLPKPRYDVMLQSTEKKVASILDAGLSTAQLRRLTFRLPV